MDDKLTDREIASINRTYGHCPDCGGDLLEGPCGGCSQNFKCMVCGEEFNLGLTEGLLGLGFNPRPSIWYGERIDRDDASLYDREKILAIRWQEANARYEDASLTKVAAEIMEEEFGESEYKEGWFKGICLIHSQFGDTPVRWTKIKCSECGSQVYQDLLQKRHRCHKCGYGF